MTADVLVEIRGVTKTFGGGTRAVRALDDVSLTIARNEFFTLLGPSGCGKSTLLRLLAGFEHADAGTLLIDGRDVAGDPPNKRPVNIVFQSYALFPHMSVARNVAFGLEQKGLRGGAVMARVRDMLRLVRLEDLADRKPGQLSGGQQQRVALARALAPAPRLLLLDEPLSALDLKLRRGMQVELKRIQRETGITFLLVTHDQEEALSMSDRIAVMDRGRVLQSGDPRTIHEAPRCRFVADFMGANVVPGVLVGRSTCMAIRPERVAIDPADGGGLPGEVMAIAYLGARTACVVELEDGTSIKVERDDLPPLAIGDRVRCLLALEAMVALEDDF